MRKQSFHTRVLLSTFTVFLMLAGGCGSGGGGSHGNSSGGITQEKVISAINGISSLTNETIKGAFLGLPANSEFSRTLVDGEDITFNVTIVEESPDGSTADVFVNREAKGTVEVDADEDGTPEFKKDVNISMTTHMKTQSEGDGNYSIIETSPTEIITTTEGLPEPGFKIQWVQILDKEGASLWQINSPDETIELSKLLTLISGSEVTVKVAVKVESPGDIGVYLYHGNEKYGSMKPDGETDGYFLYAKTYTVGPQSGQYIGFVEVISNESLSDSSAPFQSRAWLIGYTVQ